MNRNESLIWVNLLTVRSVPCFAGIVNASLLSLPQSEHQNKSRDHHTRQRRLFYVGVDLDLVILMYLEATVGRFQIVEYLLRASCSVEYRIVSALSNFGAVFSSMRDQLLSTKHRPRLMTRWFWSFAPSFWDISFFDIHIQCVSKNLEVYKGYMRL